MQAIRTKYHGPTDFRGSRISAKCEARTIYVPYDHDLTTDGNHKAACEALILAMGWHQGAGSYADMIGGYFGGDRYWVFLDEPDRTAVRMTAQRGAA